MNCKTYKNQIMLEASGELSPKSSRNLDIHIQRCKECREFAKTLNIVTESYSSINPSEAPHSSVMVNIRQAAEENLKKGQLLWFPTSVVRLTAYAAILMFIAGAILIKFIPSDTNQNVNPNSLDNSITHQETRISELSTVVAMVAENIDSVYEDDTTTEENEPLEAFARQLLEMEGFAVDDMFDDETMINLFAEPAPTTTQYHNTPAPPVKTCV